MLRRTQEELSASKYYGEWTLIRSFLTVKSSNIENGQSSPVKVSCSWNGKRKVVVETLLNNPYHTPSSLLVLSRLVLYRLPSNEYVPLPDAK
jgi:hypothetical protein